MIRRYMLLLASLLLLCGCSDTSPEIAAPSADGPLPAEATTGETSGPRDESSLETAARLYGHYLESEDCGDTQHLRLPPEIFDLDCAKDIFYVRDLTGNGVPELYFTGPRQWPFFTVQDGQMVELGWMDGYHEVLANGAIFYHRLDGAPERECFSYQGLSPESQVLPDIYFYSFDADQDGVQDTYFLGDSEEPVPYDVWLQAAAPYFEAWEQAPTEAQQSLPFSAWVLSLETSK